MAQPPADVPASELFQKLVGREPPSQELDYPRADPVTGKPVARIRVRVLSQNEVDNCRLAATARYRARNVPKDEADLPTNREILADMVAKEVIALATEQRMNDDPDVDPDKVQWGRVFRNGGDVGQLPGDEISILFSAYTLVQHKFGPMEKLDPSDTDAWIVRLAEGGSGFPLLSLSLPDVHALTTSLAESIFTLCASLASRRSTWPEWLGSTLQSCGLDTICASVRPSTGSAPGGEGSDVTITDAVRLAAALSPKDY